MKKITKEVKFDLGDKVVRVTKSYEGDGKHKYTITESLIIGIEIVAVPRYNDYKDETLYRTEPEIWQTGRWLSSTMKEAKHLIKTLKEEVIASQKEYEKKRLINNYEQAKETVRKYKLMMKK